MNPTEWGTARAKHDAERQQEIIAVALKPRVRVKAQGIPMAVTTPKPKPTKKGAKK